MSFLLTKLGKFIKQMVFSMNFDFFTHLTIWKLNIQLFWELVQNGISKYLYKFCAWNSHLSILMLMLLWKFVFQYGWNNLQIKGIIRSVNMFMSHFPIDYCMLLSGKIDTEFYIKATQFILLLNIWSWLKFNTLII